MAKKQLIMFETIQTYCWLFTVYFITRIPILRELISNYERRLDIWQDDYDQLYKQNTELMDSYKSSNEKAYKYAHMFYDEREVVGAAAEHWTRIENKRALKQCVKLFEDTSWLDSPFFDEEEKLHAEAIKTAISHSIGESFRLEMKIRNLREKNRSNYKDWLKSDKGKKYLAAVNEAVRNIK